MLMQCQVCGKGVIAVFEAPGNIVQFGQWVQGNAGMNGNAILVNTFPKLLTAAAPEHTPENVKRFYLQGMENLERHFDAAGTMFRKALDAALKQLDPAAKGTLQKRIDSLDPSIGVTPAMKQWAHEIRLLGNDAAHEDDPFTGDEAKSLQAFTEMFLTYAFTLPGMLAARKATGGTTTP